MAREDTDAERAHEDLGTTDSTEGESHATMGGAAAAGAVTGGVIGLAGGPVGAAIGAIGGALVAAAAERMMHSEGEDEEEDNNGDADEGELDSTTARVRPPRDPEE
jgi:phage tail tape-measure protein